MNFVDPETGVNTQAIESQWSPLRLQLQRGGVCGSNLDYHLCEYLWRREAKQKGLNFFAELIRSIRIVYPGVGYSGTTPT